ncbi:adenosylcobinamide-GDP ribazoletransferase [Nonomuraea muscovyensis]|uniref:Adenosylcobinamide-GDP ribazoletransferase n=1 Tax=Nonomuraea muscovyensis TaxID=1124761 RepID=A0A7X0BWF2_9ACTN|nr:adenosylcobinamide-GDP ribazoletransferase [Nonomuraea muscovyensis]MBB6344169.1 adenosylcobinamide-GDP ribazoletransferase [Nonomuraea muscovyensis]
MDAARLAIGTLTIFRVRVHRVDRRVAGRAMLLAPAVGVLVGVPASLPLVVPGMPPLPAAALAMGVLAVLTRGLHLDGLADLADGLGSGRPADRALDIMKKSDIGPFGVMTLVLTLLVQVSALSALSPGPALLPESVPESWPGVPLPADAPLTAPYALVTACVAGRLALTWACRAGVPAARPDGLGAMVAGTVRPAAVWPATLAALAVTALLGLAAAGFPLTPDTLTALMAPDASGSTPAGGAVVRGLDVLYWSEEPSPALALQPALVLPVSLLVGLGAALLLLARAGRRLGGITGDVLGALVETATAATLVTCALLA